eukprot:CAMPEP_0118979168 /NCGR_PEP_ID=MMETSP1173-20130426/25333_1 /TAXON_ID=1034831 /ORGANISM="Rhizochromulina marina cf, Strain CCMP1243" /LENGTH=250 /DNA_ID=CAMNT_0006929411 /DNA_START=101 /DNA_END=853 /DNA_ORIENTATION=-
MSQGFSVVPAASTGARPIQNGVEFMLHRSLRFDDEKGLREALVDRSAATFEHQILDVSSEDPLRLRRAALRSTRSPVVLAVPDESPVRDAPWTSLFMTSNAAALPAGIHVRSMEFRDGAGDGKESTRLLHLMIRVQHLGEPADGGGDCSEEGSVRVDLSALAPLPGVLELHGIEEVSLDFIPGHPGHVKSAWASVRCGPEGSPSVENLPPRESSSSGHEGGCHTDVIFRPGDLRAFMLILSIATMPSDRE